MVAPKGVRVISAPRGTTARAARCSAQVGRAAFAVGMAGATTASGAMARACAMRTTSTGTGMEKHVQCARVITTGLDVKMRAFAQCMAAVTTAGSAQGNALAFLSGREMLAMNATFQIVPLLTRAPDLRQINVTVTASVPKFRTLSSVNALAKEAGRQKTAQLHVPMTAAAMEFVLTAHRGKETATVTFASLVRTARRA